MDKHRLVINVCGGAFQIVITAKELLFTPCSGTCCLDRAEECGLPGIQPFAKGELPMPKGADSGLDAVTVRSWPDFWTGVNCNTPKNAACKNKICTVDFF